MTGFAKVKEDIMYNNSKIFLEPTALLPQLKPINTSYYPN